MRERLRAERVSERASAKEVAKGLSPEEGATSESTKQLLSTWQRTPCAEEAAACLKEREHTKGLKKRGFVQGVDEVIKKRTASLIKRGRRFLLTSRVVMLTISSPPQRIY
jgi:hypothetical protein